MLLKPGERLLRCFLACDNLILCLPKELEHVPVGCDLWEWERIPFKDIVEALI